MAASSTGSGGSSIEIAAPADRPLRLALQEQHPQRRPAALGRCIDKLADPVPELVCAARRIVDDDQRGLVPGPFRNVLLPTKAIKFPLLHKPGKPALLGRLADEFQGKPRFAAPGSAGQNADRHVQVAIDPLLQVFDCMIAPKQGHHVSPVGAQQRRIRIIDPGTLRARLEMRQAKVRNAGVDRNVDPAANRLDDNVVATVNVSVGGRLSHVTWPSMTCPAWGPC